MDRFYSTRKHPYHDVYGTPKGMYIKEDFPEDFTNYSYTGPSLIGLKCQGMNTAKLTYGHKFFMETTQLCTSGTETDS
jgi:hypothetical protein